MNIVFISDESYALPARAAIRSAIQNAAGDEKMNIYIICVETSKKTNRKFKELETKHASIQLIQIDDVYHDKYKNIKTTHLHVTKAALLKFEIANIFKELKKILYLDADLIVSGDLREFYGTDLGTRYAAVVPDYLENNKYERLPDDQKYFNSGVMLLNLDQLRKDHVPQKLLAHKQGETRSRFMDQNTVNVIFGENVIYAEPEYNFLVTYLKFSNKRKLKGLKMGGAPRILHYTSRKKPWTDPKAKKRDVFFRYLSPADFQACLEVYKRKKLSNKINILIGHLFYKNAKNEVRFKFFGVRILSIRQKDNKRVFHFLGKDFVDERYITVIDPKTRYHYLNKPAIDRILPTFQSNGVSSDSLRQKQLIVSLTSIPQRMAETQYALYSLLTQSLKPDKVILYLGEENFPLREQNLPQEILRLQNNGLSIHWHPELRSYTKLIPALKEYPNEIIVTADDDIYYPEYWLEKLYAAYLKAPQLIHCHRGHRIHLDADGNLGVYKQWELSAQHKAASALNFLTGVGGVLYPPGLLYKDVFDQKKFLSLCPSSDDVWFWAMATLARTKINIIHDNMRYLTYVNLQRERLRNGEVTLSRLNNRKGGNDLAIKKILDAYPGILQALTEETLAEKAL